MTVVFEVLSPGNTVLEMADKLAFYDEHGAEEYYVFDPDKNKLLVYLRGREALRRLRAGQTFVSPRLGIRFDTSGPEMVVYAPDGRRFLPFEALEEERKRERRRADEAEKRADDVEKRLARQAELMRKVLAQQATPQEREELEHLLRPPSPHSR